MTTNYPTDDNYCGIAHLVNIPGTARAERPAEKRADEERPRKSNPDQSHMTVKVPGAAEAYADKKRAAEEAEAE